MGINDIVKPEELRAYFDKFINLSDREQLAIVDSDVEGWGKRYLELFTGPERSAVMAVLSAIHHILEDRVIQ